MRPQQLKTRIFLDGGNTDETEEAIRTLGFLDGQTTNPTLISKNPGIRERIQRGEKFTPETITEFYRQTVNKISVMVPRGSVSIEGLLGQENEGGADAEAGQGDVRLDT